MKAKMRLAMIGGVLLWVGTGLACGSSDGEALPPPDSVGDVDATNTGCLPRTHTGTVTEVALEVASPLPAAFTTGCPHGNTGSLAAYLLDALPTGACALTVSGGQVRGCCEGVPANQNIWITLAFRETASNLWLAEQSKTVALPSTSPPVVSVSFAGESVARPYDTDNDQSDNLTEWCAGTL